MRLQTAAFFKLYIISHTNTKKMLCSIQGSFHSVWVCVYNRNIHNNVDNYTHKCRNTQHNTGGLARSSSGKLDLYSYRGPNLCTNCAVPSAEWQQSHSCIHERFLFNGMGTHCSTDCEKCDKKEQDTRELSLSRRTHCIPANVLQHIPSMFLFCPR